MGGKKLINRRGFLAGILASGVAPFIASSGILMPIKPALAIVSDASYAGAARVISNGGCPLTIRGRDFNNTPIVERFEINNGTGYTSLKFLHIDHVESTVWDNSAVFLYDGLGNVKIPDKVVHKTMSYFTPEEKQTLRETGWLVPKWNGNGETIVLASIVHNKDNSLVPLVGL